MSRQVETTTVEQFVRSWLPEVPARILEVGAGSGELARSLSETGYVVTAIDPKPVENDIVRPISLESFDHNEPYDSVSEALS